MDECASLAGDYAAASVVFVSEIGNIPRAGQAALAGPSFAARTAAAKIPTVTGLKRQQLLAAALHRRRNSHCFAIFGDGAARDVNAAALQQFYYAFVGECGLRRLAAD
jgi:hypothetical protein